jgi:transposase InsO family protein
VRQWVLSFPYPLHFLFASKPDAIGPVLGIEHRLTRPKSPQTNGMVERFNGRISHVLNTNRFESGEDLEQTLTRYIWLYNHHLPQKALNHETPVLALKRWQSTPYVSTSYPTVVLGFYR